MQTPSAVVTAFVTTIDATQQVEVQAPVQAEPVKELTWAERYPETAAKLAQINAAHEERARQRKVAQEEAAKRAERKRIQELSRTPEGRRELARLATKELKQREEKLKLARQEAGLGSRAKEENKQKRAERRERELAIAAQKKAEQAAQGRGKN